MEGYLKDRGCRPSRQRNRSLSASHLVPYSSLTIKGMRGPNNTSGRQRQIPASERTSLPERIRIYLFAIYCSVSFLQPVSGFQVKTFDRKTSRLPSILEGLHISADMMLRQYQRKIVSKIGAGNAIVKMPTGSGKTVVASEVIKLRLLEDCKRSALFLVPSQNLVEQQSKVLERWFPDLAVFCFTRGLADPELGQATRPRCIVSTPKAFLNLMQRKAKIFSWDKFSIVVFDEVHHVLKDHPYRHLALWLRDWHETTPAPLLDDWKVQIVGMSASLTYNVGETGIRNTLHRLCRELDVQHMISPSLKDLRQNGYVAQHGENVEVERCRASPEDVVPEKERKPHLIHSTFMKRLDRFESTEFTRKVWETVKALEHIVAEVQPAFRSPLQKTKLASWAEYAHNLKLESTGEKLVELMSHLETWYTALRLLVLSWEEDEELVLQWLKMSNGFAVHCNVPSITNLKGRAEYSDNFFKLGRLQHHLVEKKSAKGNSFRCIIFVQQRIAAVVLAHFINHDQNLEQIGLKSGYVAARESKITPTIKMRKQDVDNTLKDFRSGQLNVLVATSVIEEGFDVPAANVVISFDHLKDSVELCQRFGRARHIDSSIVVLDERQDRPLGLLESVRELQDDIIQKYDPATIEIDEGAENLKQENRERQAKVVLQGLSLVDALASLNLYVKKTKADLVEDFGTENGEAVCMLTYRSRLRSAKGNGRASSKKAAKRAAALALVRLLWKEAACYK